MLRCCPLQQFLLAMTLLTLAMTVAADSARYDYDAAGQLLRAIAPDGSAVRFHHDAAGNILATEPQAAAPSPEVTEQSLDRLRCGETVDVTVLGDDLAGAQPMTDDAGITISDVSHADDMLRFQVQADCDGALGEINIRLQTAGGEVLLSLNVDPQTPTLLIRPSPMAVAPDGGQRSFELALSHADTRPHDITLSIPDSARASLDSASAITLNAGETGAFGRVRGNSPGTTVLTASSEELGTVSVPILITESAAGVNTLIGQPLGLVSPVDEAASNNIVVTLHHTLGVGGGRGIVSVAPGLLNRGDENIPLEVTLQQAAALADLSFQPSDGVVAHDIRRLDETRLVVEVSIKETAQVGMRRLVIRDEQGSLSPLSPGADRITVSHGEPALHSVSPTRVRIGDSGVALTLRGRHLDDAIALNALPGDDLELGAPTVSTDGTEVSTQVTVSPQAAPGPRTLTLHTPNAGTDATRSASNTLHLVRDLGDPVENLAGSPLGIARTTDDDHHPGRERQLHGPRLGLLGGPHLASIEPGFLVAGEEGELLLSGRGLHAGDTVTLQPDQGTIATDLREVADDGRTARLKVLLDNDAALGERRLRVMDAQGKLLPAATPDADRIRVTAPGPVIHSVAPLYLPQDRVTELLIRGERLHDAREVIITPADDLQMETPRVADDGRTLRLRVAVAPEAETGARQLQARALAGTTSEQATAHNTVFITDQHDPPALALQDAFLGVLRPFDSPPAPGASGALVSGMAALPLGLLQATPDSDEPHHEPGQLFAELGIANTPVVLTGPADGFAPGTEATVQFGGQGLEAVQTVVVPPDTAMILDGPTASSAGDEITLDLEILPGASPGPMRLEFLDVDDKPLPAAGTANRILIGPGTPRIDSISPILAGRGDTGVLVVRGQQLDLAQTIRALGAAGMRLGAFPQVNDDGSELHVPFAIDADAPLGERVIQIQVPGAKSTDIAEPANTFTVHDSVPD